MELLLIRHAEPASEREAVANPFDPPLGPSGRKQAAALADSLRDLPLDGLYTSPLARARETAAALEIEGSCRAHVAPGLAELPVGDAYATVTELRRSRLDQVQAMSEGRWEELGMAAGFAEFTETVNACFAEIVAASPGMRVAVVCHGGVINLYLAEVMGTEQKMFFEPDYTSISRVAASRRGERTVISLNETCHLRG